MCGRRLSLRFDVEGEEPPAQQLGAAVATGQGLFEIEY